MSGHLTDEAAAAGAQLEPVQEDGHVEFVGEVAAKRLGQGTLAAADVASQNEQRRPVAEQRDGGHLRSVVFLGPLAQPIGVGEQDRLLMQPALDLIEADQAPVPLSADRFG
jgi:hypothetical protein